MSVVCPTILSHDKAKFDSYMQKVAGFAHRVQIDLTDGRFAKPKTLLPSNVWWPVGVKADIHLMYQHPHDVAKRLLNHKPHMIIVHAEASGDFGELVKLCHQHKVKVGVALLAKTEPSVIDQSLYAIDHVLIFSGSLGEYGGRANLHLLSKVAYLKGKKPELEVGWDGGINEQNISQLAFGGVDVFNAGSFIEQAAEPEKAYARLSRIAEETGTT